MRLVLVIAHECDGENDFYYAGDPDKNVYSMKNYFAPQSIRNKQDYHNPAWKATCDSIQHFLNGRMGHYLSMLK